MTVKELIEMLQDSPLEAQVCFSNPNGGRVPVQGIRTERCGSSETGTDEKMTLIVLTD